MHFSPTIGKFLSIQLEPAYDLPELTDILAALSDLDLGIAHSLNDVSRLAGYIGYALSRFADCAAYGSYGARHARHGLSQFIDTVLDAGHTILEDVGIILIPESDILKGIKVLKHGIFEEITHLLKTGLHL